jgi:hypothetical protein
MGVDQTRPLPSLSPALTSANPAVFPERKPIQEAPASPGPSAALCVVRTLLFEN